MTGIQSIERDFIAHGNGASGKVLHVAGESDYGEARTKPLQALVGLDGDDLYLRRAGRTRPPR